MKLHIGTEIPEGPDWVFEPKYDGVRDDKSAREVGREPTSVQESAPVRRQA
jgi:hypothetical protein